MRDSAGHGEVTAADEYHEGRPPVTIYALPGDPPTSFDAVFRPSLGSADHGSIPQLAGNWEFFKGALISVGVQRADEEQIRVLGTACMIAPGVAVTATHVLSDDDEALRANRARITCFGVRSASVMDVWRVTSFITKRADDDLTVLSLQPISGAGADWTPSAFTMTSRVPRVGETVAVIGFRNQGTSLIVDGSCRHEGGLYVAVGTITAFYRNGRDSVLMPFATIEIDCGSLGGMSGGAVIDVDGRLLGVVSRGLAIDDGAGPTYASWALTVLDRRVDLSWPERRTVMLFDLLDDELEIYGRHRLQLESSTLSLAPW